MTGRDIVKLLEYESSRRPEIAELVDKVSAMTDDDIANAEVPLPWFRNALKIMRDRQKIAVYSAELCNSIEISYLPDPIGEVWKYTGIDRFMPISASRSKMTNEIEINNGQMLWCASDHYWIDSFYATGMPTEWLFQSATKVGNMSRTEYLHACRQRLSAMPEIYDPRDQRDGFRIIRH